MDKKLLRIKQVIEYVPFGKSKLWEVVAKEEFPQPIKIGRSTFWIESEVISWVEQKISDYREPVKVEEAPVAPKKAPKTKTIERVRRRSTRKPSTRGGA